jgi:hypothetical protein
LNPNDIYIANCVLEKSDDMRERTADGKPKWMVKNLFELKRPTNVVFENNVLRHSWVGPQNGFGQSAQRRGSRMRHNYLRAELSRNRVSVPRRVLESTHLHEHPHSTMRQAAGFEARRRGRNLKG